MHGSHFAEIPIEGFVSLSTMVPFDPSNSILQICSDRIVRDHFILRISFFKSHFTGE